VYIKTEARREKNKMKTTQILIAGFGGQGILFSGKFLAYKGLMEELQVSWLPSYGPEMRGGTANCNVILSDDPVGSPIITAPDVLIAMNLPSLQKYVDSVVSGGQIYVDSSLIDVKVERNDVEVFYIPATQMAKDEGIATLANMIILGHFLENNKNMSFDGVLDVVEKLVPPKKASLKELNIKALSLGKDYKA
jgi:2-oxoglutarate ferredoxin oxidoreductase subunit gamma